MGLARRSEARAAEGGAVKESAQDGPPSVDELVQTLEATLRSLEQHLNEAALAAGLKDCRGLCPCWENEVTQARAVLKRAKTPA